MYNSLISYYFTGTGNSYRISTWIVEEAKRKLMDAKSLPFSRFDKDELEKTGNETIINFCFPIHAFTAPWSVIKFAKKMPKGNGRSLFITTARGGGTFLKDAPGCEGTANYLIALILALKGYNIIGSESIDMPENWNVMLTAYTDKKNEHIIKVSNEIVKEVADKIFNGKKVYGGFISLLIGLVLSPISLAYMLTGKFFLPKIFLSNYKCTGCGLCEKACPTKSIVMLGKKEKRPYWKFSCESCMRCTAYCPNNAVEANHILLILAMFIALDTGIFNIINGFLRMVMPIDLSAALTTVLQVILGLVFAYCSHRILFLLNRNKLINKITTYLSLTHIFKRYKEPNTKIEDIM